MIICAQEYELLKRSTATCLNFIFYNLKENVRLKILIQNILKEISFSKTNKQHLTGLSIELLISF